MSAINRFLLANNLRIATNPCVSPDFCLDWPALRDELRASKAVKVYEKSRFDTAAGAFTLVENAQGDCAWRLQGDAAKAAGLHDAVALAAAGAKVMVAARRVPEGLAVVEQLQASGAEAAYFAVDVTDEAQLAAVVAATVARFGRLDVLINDAGIIQVGPLQQVCPCDAQARHRLQQTGNKSRAHGTHGLHSAHLQFGVK